VSRHKLMQHRQSVARFESGQRDVRIKRTRIGLEAQRCQLRSDLAFQIMQRQLKSIGVSHVSISAPPGAAAQTTLRTARQEMADLALILVWDLPVPYASQNPIRLEESGRNFGRGWLYVEPDGDVLPTQGEAQVLGNLTRDSILQLWERDALAVPTSPA